ncbi:Protein SPEC3 [Dirofilaria immitis]|nr:Protein SPEC3 [Dirofilaria immitis]
MDESRPMNAPKKKLKIQTMLPDVIEYGIEQGIIPKRQDKNDKRPGDTRIHLPTNDITLMHSAVPFLPLPVAIFCAILNFIIPGLGTIMSGLFALCLGQTRVNYREGQKLMTVLINSLVGISQFFTITFLFVGWFWSMAWGVQYRDALRQRRQEAIATAALEALTRDSILHRRDVKTLVIEHKEKTETKKRSRRAKHPIRRFVLWSLCLTHHISANAGIQMVVVYPFKR